MIRSRRLSDYRAYEFSSIRPEVTLPCDLYLLFPKSDHVLIFKKSGETPEKESLERYLKRGLREIWIYSEDMPLFEAYLHPNATEAPAPTTSTPESEAAKPEAQIPAQAIPLPEEAVAAAPALAQAASEVALDPPKTEAGAAIAALMESDKVTEEQRAAAVAEVAQELFMQAAVAENPLEQQAADETIRQAMNDVIQRSALKDTPALRDLWSSAQSDPEFEHGVNVATYAVCFALAFGKSAPQVIADLTIAGLLHDIGMSQLPPSIASKTWTQMTESEQQLYHRHVEASEALLSELDRSVPTGALELIRLHHEKFDGTGYPSKVQGFAIPDTAQILSMADLLETIRSGLWDGTIRTRKEAYALLEERDKNRSYPEYFNPETFKRVKTFIHSSAGQEAFDQASTDVSEKAKQITQAA